MLTFPPCALARPQVDDFKDGGGVDGATSSIYQKASGTLSASDGSKPYDKIISDVRPLSAGSPFLEEA